MRAASLCPPNDVGDPDLARFAFLLSVKAAAATSITGCPFPIHLNLFESGVEHDIANFRDAPHPPIVGKGTFASSAVLRFEVDAESGSIVDRIEVLLLEDVGEARKSLRIKGRLAGLRAAESVHHEESVLAKGLSARLEVSKECRPLMEAEVTEIERADDVGLSRVPGENVALNGFDTLLLGWGELREVVRRAVGERLRIDIETDGLLSLVKLHPFAAEREGSAKVLAHRRWLALVEVAVDEAHETGVFAGRLY